MTEDHILIAEFCRTMLDLENAQLSDEYYYKHLPLCIIDAIFSIGVNYTSTRNTVIRFCDHFGLERILREGRPPPRREQFTVTHLLQVYDELDATKMAEEVYQNRQRTSPRGGILKAEAVLRFAEILHAFGVNFFQEMHQIIGDPAFETQIKDIPGQASGISLRYFYMLVGRDDYIKPDRMISRFVNSAIDKTLGVEGSHTLIVRSCEILAQDYPHLTPRLLDHLIWRYQRSR